MKLKPIITLSLLSLSLPTLGARYIGYLGGSGDPPGATTLFDAKIAGFGRYADQSDAQVNVAFDGGHSATESALRRSFPRSPARDFTKSSYEEMISRYEQDIRNGTIKSGDQLLVVVDSHGGRRFGPHQTHTIVSGRGSAVDLNDLKGSETVSLDRLTALTRLAEEKGIKLGILDFSCHSGASLPLANSKTCVIAASGPESFAYGGTNPTLFSNRFANAVAPGKNLEEIYLESRSGSQDLGFAMISSPEGMRVQQQLYPVLQKFINHFDTKSDKFNPEILASVKDQTCLQENSDVERILELTRQIEEVNSGVSLEAFRNSLSQYRDYRKSIQDELQRRGVGRLNETRRICANDGHCQSLTLDLVMGFAADTNLAYYQEQLRNASTPADRRDANKWISYFQNAKVVQAQALKDFPQLNGYENFVKSLPDVERKTRELASKVSVESRKIYSALYRKNSTSNPCRDFVL